MNGWHRIIFIKCLAITDPLIGMEIEKVLEILLGLTPQFTIINKVSDKRFDLKSNHIYTST